VLEISLELSPASISLSKSEVFVQLRLVEHVNLGVWLVFGQVLQFSLTLDIMLVCLYPERRHCTYYRRVTIHASSRITIPIPDATACCSALAETESHW
jgi:hypothetical protein